MLSEPGASAYRKTAAIDTTTAHPARRYDYWLGGKDNFEADRVSGDAILEAFPYMRTSARENRGFLRRSVRELARLGIKQFLDVGTGIPTSPNTHEVAQDLNPKARVVYVDNDALVLVHARALLTSCPAGATSYIDADMRQPEQILRASDLTDTLDLTQPVALMFVASLHFVSDIDEAYKIVDTLMSALAPGSYLVASHATYDPLDDATIAGLNSPAIPGKGSFTSRTREEFAGFFDGLDLIEPGITMVNRWRPDPETDDNLPPEQVSTYGGVALKPG